jgi:diguanylate cyclase (GGDEF)-like protein
MADPETQANRLPAAYRRRPARPDARASSVQSPDPPVRRAPGNPLVAEIDALKAELAAARAEIAALRAQADVDPLLGILNRRGFTRELKRALAYAERYGTAAALIYFDLDCFKAINDTHGHTAGDRVLATVATTLTRNVRASDVVGRLGGDEFAVVLWAVSEAATAAKAEALERAVAAAATAWNGAWLRVEISTGIAMLAPGDEPADVIARADRAMYTRKPPRR